MSIKPCIKPTVRPASNSAVSGAGGEAPADSLLTDLVSWWSLDEASGTRVDAHGSNDLTDVNTVGQAAGVVSNAASFVSANNELLQINTPPANLGLGGSRTWALWVYPTTDPAGANFTLIGMRSSVNEYAIRSRANTASDGAHDADFIAWNSSNTLKQVTITGAITQNAWNFICCYYDEDNQEIGVSVNNGTFTTIATGTATMQTGNNLFAVGARTSASELLDGRLDEVAIWSRVLTSSEITSLYNSGNGIGYPG